MPYPARRRCPWLVAVVVAVMVVAACACSSNAGQSAPVDAGRFSASRADGTSVTVPGSTPSVVYFFSAGCSQGAAAVAEAQRRAAGATYVAVDIDPGQGVAQMRAVLQAAGAPDLAVTGDPDAAIMTSYGVPTVGTTVVLDSTGKAVFSGVEASTGAITAAVGKVAGG
jgi:hypothetical protein